MKEGIYWLLVLIYLVILVYTIIRILLDTRSTPKTLGYLLLVMIVPVAGIILYYSFGINYRHLSSTFKESKDQSELDKAYVNLVNNKTDDLRKSAAEEIGSYDGLVNFLENIGTEYLSENHFKLLVNGEQKFPEVLSSLQKARHFIHMEYYDWENDTRGNEIKNILLEKVKEGVEVRVLYDDYASRKIKRNIVKELKNGGVLIYPKIKLRLRRFANRVNHRDHRKLIIIDGAIGFIGGINISDRYDNTIDTGLYWRDTHMKISGPLVNSLQRHFVVSWNSSAKESLQPTQGLFPVLDNYEPEGIPALGQVIAGGPIYPMSNIMLSYFRIFTLASKKLYITNPYFIPNESILDALKESAVSGVDVRLMLPDKSDSAIVGAASRFYFHELLKAGVRIFLYRKGFVHAKTVVADGRLSVVGTANMDIRSFDLNFEIMSVVYGKEFAAQLEGVFMQDLTECREISLEDFEENTGVIKKLAYSIARLISSFL